MRALRRFRLRLYITARHARARRRVQKLQKQPCWRHHRSSAFFSPCVQCSRRARTSGERKRRRESRERSATTKKKETRRRGRGKKKTRRAEREIRDSRATRQRAARTDTTRETEKEHQVSTILPARRTRSPGLFDTWKIKPSERIREWGLSLLFLSLALSLGATPRTLALSATLQKR